MAKSKKRKSHGVSALYAAAYAVALGLASYTGMQIGNESPEPIVTEQCSFRLIVVRVIDGDTVEGHVPLPWNIMLHHEKFRASDFDAWEKREPGGEAATVALKALIGEHGFLIISPDQDEGRDNFGRLLGKWYYVDVLGIHPVSDFMKRHGHDKNERKQDNDRLEPSDRRTDLRTSIPRHRDDAGH